MNVLLTKDSLDVKVTGDLHFAFVLNVDTNTDFGLSLTEDIQVSDSFLFNMYMARECYTDIAASNLRNVDDKSMFKYFLDVR